MDNHTYIVAQKTGTSTYFSHEGESGPDFFRRMASLYKKSKRPRCRKLVGGGDRCKHTATIGMVLCYQHGGVKCYCPQYQSHSGSCCGTYCSCH